MLQQRSIHSGYSFRDKLLSIDYVLVLSILVLGIISMFAMYSTDGGEFKYHTNSHILRFCIFFGLFFVVAFAPYKNPQYAISVVVEHGGSGGKAAAPIAQKVIKKVLERHELRQRVNQLTGEPV